jgi:putative membrane protein
MERKTSKLKAFIDRSFPTLFSRIAMIAVIVLPLVYSVLYLWAFWDPYKNLDRLPVAFVNLDKGGVKDGKAKNIGQELEDELKTDDNLQWHFTTLQEAQSGLEQKKYYSYILIPEDFTQSILTVDQGNPHKATLQLKTRQASSVISATIVNRVTSEVSEKLSHKVSEEYFDNIFIQSRETVQDLKKAVDGAKDLKDGLADAKNGSQDLTSGLQDALDGGAKLQNGLNDALSGSKSLLSGVYSAYQGAGDLRGGISDLSDGAASLRDHLASAYAGSQTLSSGAQSLAKGASDLSAGLQQAADGSSQIVAGIQQSDSGAATLAGGLSSLASNMPALQQGMSGIGQAASAVNGQAQAVAGLSGQAGAEVQTILTNHPELSGDTDFQALQQNLGSLQTQAGTLAGTASALANAQGQVSGGIASSSAAITQLSTGAAQLKGGLDELNTKSSSLPAGLTQLQQGAQQLATGASAAVSGAGSLSNGLGQLKSGADTLVSGMGDAYNGANKLYSGIGSLSGGAQQLVNGMNTLTDGSQTLVNGLGDLQDGGQKLANGLADADSGSQELYQKLDEGYQKSKDQVSEAKTDVAKPVMADPVKMDEEMVDPVKSYGTGFTPYFVPLSLWVGAMAIFFILKPMSNKEARQYRGPRLLLELTLRYLAFGIIGVLQSVVLILVLMRALGLQPNHLGWFYAFTIMGSLLDIAIFECLTYLMDEAGVFIGVVVLMLQLTSSAGTYPKETMPIFFSKIAPYLPMTYMVSGLRDIISGSTVHIEDTMMAFGIAIVLLILLTALLKRLFSELSARKEIAIASIGNNGLSLPALPGFQPMPLARAASTRVRWLNRLEASRAQFQADRASRRAGKGTSAGPHSPSKSVIFSRQTRSTQPKPSEPSKPSTSEASSPRGSASTGGENKRSR